SAPLDDPEQPSRAFRPDFACPALPTERAAPGLLGRGVLDRVGWALVEHHRDIDPQADLRVDDALGREADRRAVEVALEGDAAVIESAQAPQAPDLKPAAVGEDRPAPAGEGVEAAQALDHVDAGPQRQMVEVRELDR